MMTTGYDCEDILNVALMRPIFSPSDFVQIKGRGTRKFEFEYETYATRDFLKKPKERFKLFDFFANCEYFETEFKYDEQLKLPVVRKASINYEPSPSEFVDERGESIFKGPIDLRSPDELESISEMMVGEDGMRIDREGFRRAVAEDVVNNETLKALWQNGDLEEAEEYTKKHVFDKPHHFLNLEKIKKAFNLDRRVSIKEFLQVAFGQKDGFEMKDDLLESEWQKFQEITEVDQEHYTSTKHFFKAFIVDEEVRNILQENALAKLEFCPSLSLQEYVDVNGYQKPVQQYVKDYVSLNTFMN
jgi:type I restriction enzyme R subunit